MDFQFWIWLIVIVITLIARANKKNAPKPPQEDVPDDTPQGRPQKAITFEDLLREIQGEKTLAKQPQPQPQPKPVREYEVVDYDDNLGEEEQDLEDVNYDPSKDDKAFETYEAAKKMAFERPSLEETSRLEDTDMQFGQFKGYERKKKKKKSFDFLREIKDPKGFKKAFIMSEILHRKY